MKIYNSIIHLSSKCFIKPILFILFVILIKPSYGQVDSFFIIKKISIKDDSRTNPNIIYRVIDFKVQDTLWSSEIEALFHKNEKRIYDTKLYNIATISYLPLEHDEIEVIIDLHKSWYIFPAPIFELGAENFDIWWKTYNRSLKWINYGVRLTHINLTGNQDGLKLVYQSGFTQKYEIDYTRPYLFHSPIGFSANIYYTTNKSAGYQTIDNRVIHYEDKNNVVLTRFRLDGTLYHRPSPLMIHLIKFQFHHNTINDSIAIKNPDYFLAGKRDLKFLHLEYFIKYDKRVFKLYPEAGFMTFLSIKKQGLGIFKDINILILELGYDQYFNAGNNWLFQLGIKIRKQLLHHKIPYANYTGVGYGNNFIRGYESYIMDGKDYYIGRSSIRKKIASRTLTLGQWMPLKPYKKMFSVLYLRFNLETGYINDPYYSKTNSFNNTYLLGFGPALDLILYNNHLFSLEYNINIAGNHGIYLHNYIAI